RELAVLGVGDDEDADLQLVLHWHHLYPVDRVEPPKSASRATTRRRSRRPSCGWGSRCSGALSVAAREVRLSRQPRSNGGARKMCHEQWMRREWRRQERFDKEIRHLIDEERPRPERPEPGAERGRGEAP